MKNFLSVILTGLLIFSTAFAGDGDGGYAGSFFQIPIGARPTALGGAYTAVADDGAGPLYNPAGITIQRSKLFATSYRALTLDRDLGYISLVLPSRENSAIGFNWHYFRAGGVQMRDGNGREVGDELAYTSHAISLLFAKQFESYLSVGMRASYLQSFFAEMSSFSVGIDLGAMLYLNQFLDRESRDSYPLQDMRVGLAVRNIAAKFRWNSDDYNRTYGGPSGGVDQQDDLPIEVALGVSTRLLQTKLMLTSDLVVNAKQSPRFHSGVEYLITPIFMIRAGFDNGRLTAGTGYLFDFSGYKLAADYAFSTEKAGEGSEHIFSFDLLF